MTEKELLQYSLDWDAAIVTNNAKKIRGYMTDDWVCVATNGGITTLDTFLEQIHSGLLTHHEMSTQDSRVRVYGNTGIVTGKGYSKGTFKGEAFSFHEWSTSVFVLKGTEWKCVLTMLADV